MRYAARNYAARLARLEKLAGKDSCPVCRLECRQTWHAPPPDPALFATATCEVCGARQTVSLRSVEEGLRPMARLYSEATTEDIFTDPRAWAAFRWVQSWNELLRTRGRVARRMAAGQGNLSNHSAGARAQGSDVKLRARLESEAHTKRTRVYNRLRARYGENPFPDLAARMAAVEPPDYRGLYEGEPFAFHVPPGQVDDAEREAGLLLKCAEAERIALGDMLPCTAQALEDCELRALKLIDEGRQKHEELEMKRQKEEAERERIRRERSERKAAAPAPAPQAEPVMVASAPAADLITVLLEAINKRAGGQDTATIYQPDSTRRYYPAESTARGRRVQQRYKT